MHKVRICGEIPISSALRLPVIGRSWSCWLQSGDPGLVFARRIQKRCKVQC